MFSCRKSVFGQDSAMKKRRVGFWEEGSFLQSDEKEDLGLPEKSALKEK